MLEPLTTSGPRCWSDKLKNGNFIFCSTGGNTVEEAGLLKNWISVKSLFFFLTFHWTFAAPPPLRAFQRPPKFTNTLDWVPERVPAPTAPNTSIRKARRLNAFSALRVYESPIFLSTLDTGIEICLEGWIFLNGTLFRET